MDVKNSKDPNGMAVFHYLLQDIKCMVFSIINMHFRIKPTQWDMWNDEIYIIINVLIKNLVNVWFLISFFN